MGAWCRHRAVLTALCAVLGTKRGWIFFVLGLVPAPCCAGCVVHGAGDKDHRQPEGATTRRRALLHGVTSTARARAQQHGGVRFYKADMTPRQQHGGVRFCRSGHGSQGTAARRRALLSGATSARAKQHGGVCFHIARALLPSAFFLMEAGFVNFKFFFIG
jgi:hypothetical protein